MNKKNSLHTPNSTNLIESSLWASAKSHIYDKKNKCLNSYASPLLNKYPLPRSVADNFEDSKDGALHTPTCSVKSVPHRTNTPKNAPCLKIIDVSPKLSVRGDEVIVSDVKACQVVNDLIPLTPVDDLSKPANIVTTPLHGQSKKSAHLPKFDAKLDLAKRNNFVDLSNESARTPRQNGDFISNPPASAKKYHPLEDLKQISSLDPSREKENLSYCEKVSKLQLESKANLSKLLDENDTPVRKSDCNVDSLFNNSKNSFMQDLKTEKASLFKELLDEDHSVKKLNCEQSNCDKKDKLFEDVLAGHQLSTITEATFEKTSTATDLDAYLKKFEEKFLGESECLESKDAPLTSDTWLPHQVWNKFCLFDFASPSSGEAY